VAGDLKQKFGTSGQAFTITIASLANASARQSTAIDNTTDLFNEVLVFLKIKTGASGTATTGYLNVYVYGSVDGSIRTENAGASDAAITLTSPTNALWIGTISAVANATTYYAGPFSVSKAFNGVIPASWGIIIENRTGGTLDTTGGNHSALYQGVYGQYTG